LQSKGEQPAIIESEEKLPAIIKDNERIEAEMLAQGE
jgi:hypothetical protein